MKDNTLVFIKNDTPLTTSLIVAEQFDKTHKHVLEAIENLITDMGSAQKSANSPRYFVKSSYVHPQNKRTFKVYLLTRDGFSLLAMGFTGKKALEFKLKFIDAFNRMEQALSAPQIVRDARWLQTRLGTKTSHRPFTEAIKMLIEYLESRGQRFHDASFVYGHFTNLIQDACGVKCGQRDNSPVANLNKLDQVQSMVANVIVKLIADGKVRTLAEVKAHVILQLQALDRLLGGDMPLLNGGK